MNLNVQNINKMFFVVDVDYTKMYSFIVWYGVIIMFYLSYRCWSRFTMQMFKQMTHQIIYNFFVCV